ncbi:Uncharacterized protein FWK35_00003758, partial [Aphis craccivora]
MEERVPEKKLLSLTKNSKLTICATFTKKYTFYSERNDECRIITSRNNAPISNFGGGFRCKSEYPWCIIELKFLRNPSKTQKFA